MRIDQMVFTRKGPPIQESELRQVEEKIGVPLPTDYRHFLLMFNGGQSKLCVCDKPFLRMEFWSSITEEEDLPFIVSILKTWQNLRGELGDDLLTIGADVLDNPVVMKVHGPDRFRIGIWHFEREMVEEMQFPFASFTDLMDHFVQTDEFR